jgi:hypothetical protein
MRILAGFVLLAVPVWFALISMVPVPQYRVGGIDDFLPAIRACLALYGGAAAGLVTVLLSRSTSTSAGTVFRACFGGSMFAVILGIVIAGSGNLWGLVLIFGAAFSAIIALGVQLVWEAMTAPQ